MRLVKQASVTISSSSSSLLSLSLLLVAIMLCCLPKGIEARDSTRHYQVDDTTGHIPSTREEIYAKRARRKNEFGDRYESLKTQMEDHHSGRRRLMEGEVTRLEKKMLAYQRKLEQLDSEFDDRHVTRILEREEMLNELHRARVLNREL